MDESDTNSRVTSDLCPHFGECGGCQYQDEAYEAQLARKGAELAALFAPWRAGPVEVAPSPVQWYYRNKVDLTFGRKFYPEPPPKDFERETVLGFKRKGRWFWPLEIQECRIASPETAGLLAAVRDWRRREGLPGFDTRKHTGLLKILLIREGKRTGERMVVLITAPGEFDGASFAAAVQASYPATSVQWGVHRGLAEVAMADEVHVLAGAPHITEELHIPSAEGARKLSFRLSPFSFFQTNTLGTEVLYGKIREWVRARQPEVLYDLYGGSGGIAFACADLAGEVISVEEAAGATADGEHNRGRNGIGNVAFVTERVERYLRGQRDAEALRPDGLVILDPPRAGLHPKALRRIMEWRPPEILYVSCKPAALAQEMETLAEAYDLVDLEAVDMFPHTRHVEALARLRARAT